MAKKYKPRLAKDGKPLEMFQDVLRASHRWLLDHSEDYRTERLSIEQWMRIHSIPQGQLDKANNFLP